MVKMGWFFWGGDFFFYLFLLSHLQLGIFNILYFGHSPCSAVTPR